MSASKRTDTQSTPKRNLRKESSLLENFEYSIFTTVEDSQFVIASEE